MHFNEVQIVSQISLACEYLSGPQLDPANLFPIWIFACPAGGQPIGWIAHDRQD